MSRETKNRGRGPLGTPTNSPVIDSGTSARIRNRPPVPVGTRIVLAETVRTPSQFSREPKTLELPQLQPGSKGAAVERLQRLLNSRLEGDTALKIDGVFGPKTRAAVSEFQKKSDLKPDAIVGVNTWFTLIAAEPLAAKTKPVAKPAQGSGGKPFVTGASIPKSTAVTTNKADDADEESIDQWSQVQRFTFVITHCGPYLSEDLRKQFEALLTAENIAWMAGFFAAAAVGAFFGETEIVGAVLFVVGLWLGGPAAIDAAKSFWNFMRITATAPTKKELRYGASEFAKVVTFLGVVGLFLLIHRLGKATGKKLRTAKGDAPSKAPQKTAKGGSEDNPPKKLDDKPPKESKEPPEPPKETAQEAADRLLKKASAAEKKVTPDLQKLADAHGAKMEGLKYRLKTQESLTRKIANDALEKGKTPTEAAQNVNDALRYTMVFDKKNLATGANGIMKSLEDAGYTKVRVKNTFKPGAVYKGVNTTFESPEGQKFELQFHTPESFDVKQNVNHTLYEKARLPKTSNGEKAALLKQMRANSESVAQPDNVDQIKSFP